jgi:heparanase
VADDFIVLSDMVKTTWEGSAAVPRVIGPDNTLDEEWFPRFLARAGPRISGVNIHLYALGAGKSPGLQSLILNPLDPHLQSAQETAANLSRMVRNRPETEALEMWVGEDGGAYNSGQNGTTNRFTAGFWSLNELGIFARNGFTAYCRQTLLGGNYGLVDKDTLLPNPDFFNYLLFKTLMGPAVLDIGTDPSAGAVSDLAVYAHCTRGAPAQGKRRRLREAGYPRGSVTMLVLNFNPVASYRITGVGEAGAGPGLLEAGKSRHEYLLTSSSPNALNTTTSSLNGKELRVTPDGQYPDLSPKVVLNGDSAPLIIAPRSYGFVVFPDANLPACA